jgi:hypothetical protein
MAEESNLSVILRAIDLKKRDYWDQLSDEQKKKHSNYLALRWASSISGNGELAQYYVLSTNQQVNKNFWSLNKHPKLQWLLTTCISPGMGSHKHEWIAFKAKGSKSKTVNILLEAYPTMKLKDAELLDKQMTRDDYKRLLTDLGWQDNEIKKALEK